MDLSNIKAAERVLEIMHPATGEATGVKLMLRPPTDPKVDAVRRRLINSMLAKKTQKQTADSMEADSIALLSATVADIEFTGDALWNGEKPAFSAALVKEMLSVVWLRKQVDEAVGDTEAFFPS